MQPPSPKQSQQAVSANPPGCQPKNSNQRQIPKMNNSYKDFRVRHWQSTDRQAVADLIATVLAEFGLGWDPEHTDQDVVNVEAAYQETGGEFWVVEAAGTGQTAGTIVGTAGYYPVSRGEDAGMQAVEIRKMYLAPTARKQGLGRWLLTQLEQQIKARGYTHIWIETVSQMQAAIHLYESSGYQRDSNVLVPRCDRSYLKSLV
jgi:putative acetyltransferase